MTIFRLQGANDGSLKNGQGWFPSAKYQSTEISNIADPDGGKGSDPTSIPTPFARMDLVRTAFKFVNAHGLEGETSFHSIVSQALDVGEMFFNFGSFGDQLSVLEWDRDKEVNDLINSPHPENVRYGKTLHMYLQQDANSFHFNHARRIFILLYNNIPIGGTSPVSLFFSAGNDFSYLNIPFPAGNKAFVDVAPIYKRDRNFLQYLFALRSYKNGFAGFFPEVDEYLKKTFDHIRQEDMAFFNELNQYDGSQYTSDYVAIGQGVFALDNLPLKQINGKSMPVNSHFTIRATKSPGTQPPLVLRKDHPGVAPDGSAMHYWQGAFSPAIEVPPEDPAALEDRYLPGLTGIRYPYLTIGDFLEPYIIRTVFPINRQRFHDGNYLAQDGAKDISWLLPIKKRFFDYFSPEDLDTLVGDGRKMLEIQPRAGNAVKVYLRIPIAKGYIEYERIYQGPLDDLDQPKPDLENNVGAISERRMDMAIFPFFQFDSRSATPEYRISLLDGDNSAMKVNDQFSLGFYRIREQAEPVNVFHQRKRVHKKQHVRVGLEHFVLRDNFDFIEVSIQGKGITGMILPRWEVMPGGGDQFTFAVDLGTTYTHIEYSINNGVAKPFSVGKDDLQLVKLHDPGFRNIESVFPEATEVFDKEFIPELIGQGQDYYFPVRTSVLELTRMDSAAKSFSLVERSIPFVYEKKSGSEHCKFEPGLKWGTDARTGDRIESFISTLFLMIRNKVLMNNGSLANTRLLWFYPLSMMDGRRYQLEKKWVDLFARYVTPLPEARPVAVSESMAPFHYFHQTENVIAYGNPVISIDIGGETTDVVVFTNNKPVMVTSFRFAADAAFGNPYRKHAADSNAFVRTFGDKVTKDLHANTLTELSGVYKDIKDRQLLRDIIAFYFSLEKNKSLKDNNIDISFNRWLSDNEDSKVVFALFYSSIMYHIAKMIKAKDLPMPRYITFSGTGSKLLDVLSPSTEPIEQLTQLIFEKITGKKAEKEGLTIKRNEITPKEVTCKGGLLAGKIPSMDISSLKAVMLGSTDDLFVGHDVTYQQVGQEELLRSVEKEVLAFYRFFTNLMEKNEFDFSKFLVKTQRYSRYREALEADVFNYINEGLDVKRQELESEDQLVEETLFFYAVKGGIDNLIQMVMLPLEGGHSQDS